MCGNMRSSRSRFSTSRADESTVCGPIAACPPAAAADSPWQRRSTTTTCQVGKPCARSRQQGTTGQTSHRQLVIRSLQGLGTVGDCRGTLKRGPSEAFAHQKRSWGACSLPPAHLYQHACEAVQVALGPQDAVHKHCRGHILGGGIRREAHQVALQQLVRLRAKRCKVGGPRKQAAFFSSCARHLQGLTAVTTAAHRPFESPPGADLAEQQGLEGPPAALTVCCCATGVSQRIDAPRGQEELERTRFAEGGLRHG